MQDEGVNGMSQWDDFQADNQFEMDFPFGLPSDVWTKRDGTKINLSEMTESHIINCMNIVGEDDGWHGRFQRELDRRTTARAAYEGEKE